MVIEDNKFEITYESNIYAMRLKDEEQKLVCSNINLEKLINLLADNGVTINQGVSQKIIEHAVAGKKKADFPYLNDDHIQGKLIGYLLKSDNNNTPLMFIRMDFYEEATQMKSFKPTWPPRKEEYSEKTYQVNIDGVKIKVVYNGDLHGSSTVLAIKEELIKHLQSIEPDIKLDKKTLEQKVDKAEKNK